MEQTLAESAQLISTFNEILMISRLETGYSAESTARVNLAAIVADVVELYEPVAEEIGVMLSAQADIAVHIDGNRELIGQALSNVVDNAIKYSAGSSERPAATVSLVKEADAARLVVCDNGPGIPEDEHNRVTERFVRLETSRSRPGSGLGLSLAKAVMIFHGGRLELAGKEGGGLEVAMIFPTGKNG